MVYYRSDWPEVGLPAALNEPSSVDSAARLGGGEYWVHQTEVAGAACRWIATQSEFESNLYGFPIWSLRLEIDDADAGVLAAQLNSPVLRESVTKAARQLSDVFPWRAAYISAKVVKGESLCDALCKVGFEQVESRRIYHCRARDIISEASPFSGEDVCFTSLAAIDTKQLQAYRQQILDICREAFGERGHSRHFTDPVLLERLPGIAYILAVMDLNFERVAPSHFLVAVDVSSDRVRGFSVIGGKPGLGGHTYTQLLSAVRKAYRGRGVYRGLTHLLSQVLPQDATLLNVTHVDNRAIQRAYQGSGRAHLADTVVVRRLYDAGGLSNRRLVSRAEDVQPTGAVPVFRGIDAQ
jgi:GNAT superfamily N-acetyltransferase